MEKDIISKIEVVLKDPCILLKLYVLVIMFV